MTTSVIVEFRVELFVRGVMWRQIVYCWPVIHENFLAIMRATSKSYDVIKVLPFAIDRLFPYGNKKCHSQPNIDRSRLIDTRGWAFESLKVNKYEIVAISSWA